MAPLVNRVCRCGVRTTMTRGPNNTTAGASLRGFRAIFCIGCLMVSLWPTFPSIAAESTAGLTNCHWFEVPIEVTNVPPQSHWVPLSIPLDLTALLGSVHVTSAPDTHALRLLRLWPDGTSTDEPYQYTPSEQPRVRARKVLPSTAPGISYISEYAAGEQPPVKAAGMLSWAMRSFETGHAQYRLEIGVPAAGRVIQVPYSPQDLHAFAEGGDATTPRWFPKMQIHPQQPIDGGVGIFHQRDLVTKYYTGPMPGASAGASPYRRPFLYPVNGPDGIPLTEFGKSHDPTGSHNHHYSLWIAHNSVNGADFWSERGGTIAHDQFSELEDGPLYCRVRQKAAWNFGPTNVLREVRTVTFYDAGDFRLIDFALEFTPAGSNGVTFGKTSFGFLAARMAPSMSPFDGGGEIVNANGDRNEQAAHLRHAGWLDQSGPIAPGKWGGIAILDHPDNPGYPTVWHCRNDGWAGAAFNAERPYTLVPGHPLKLRYRVVLHRGNAVEGEVGRRFNEWVARPIVSVGAVQALNEAQNSKPAPTNQ